MSASQSVTMIPIGTKISSVGPNVDATLQGYYTSSFSKALADIMLAEFRLPHEITRLILEFSGHIVWHEVPGTRTYRTTTPRLNSSDFVDGGEASTPPSNGSSPFIDKVPPELRRAILSKSLPSRGQTIQPTCNNYIDLTSSPGKRDNRLADLMLINKKMRDEITEVVYEERTFGVHVHQGFRNAGIEFLNVGRQPLQYLDHSGDLRFVKFRTGEMFGFCRLKKVEIQIFPSDDTQHHHHTATNTYFMNLALVRLLQRNSDNEAERVSLIRIIFVDPKPKTSTNGRRAIMATESPWWDVDRNRPRESGIHSIPDIELVLRPFALLSRCHQVEIQLPAKLKEHGPTMNFVVTLQRCMTGPASQNTLVSDALDKKIESARYALEDFISKKLFGGTSADRLKITDEEMEDAREDPGSDDDDDAGKDRKKHDDNDNDNSGDDSDHDEGGDGNMGRPRRHCSHEDLQDTKKHKTNATSFSRFGIANFNESGGFPEDPDAFDGNVDITPDPTLQKIATLAECFEVTGDVARIFLRIAEYDLDYASQLMVEMDVMDAEEIEFNMSRRDDDSTGSAEGQRAELPDRSRGSSEQKPSPPPPPPPPRKPSKSEKNNKGKGKAVVKDEADQDMPDTATSFDIGRNIFVPPNYFTSRMDPFQDDVASRRLQTAAPALSQVADLVRRIDSSDSNPFQRLPSTNMPHGFLGSEAPTRRLAPVPPTQHYNGIAPNNEVPEPQLPDQFPPADRALAPVSRPRVVVRRDSVTDMTMTYTEQDDDTPTPTPAHARARRDLLMTTPSGNSTQTDPDMSMYSEQTRNLLQGSSRGFYNDSWSSFPTSDSSFHPSSAPQGMPESPTEMSQPVMFQQVLLEQARLRQLQTQTQTQHLRPGQYPSQHSQSQQGPPRQNGGIGSGRGFFARLPTQFPSHMTAPSSSSPYVAASNNTSTTTTAQTTSRALTTPGLPDAHLDANADDGADGNDNGETMDVDGSDSSPDGGALLNREDTQDSGF